MYVVQTYPPPWLCIWHYGVFNLQLIYFILELKIPSTILVDRLHPISPVK